jgi:hypothetical protein
MAAKFLREMFARIVVKVGDDDYGTLIGQAASAGRPKASGAAGYKNPLPRDSAGARLSHHGMILASVLSWILTP